MSPDLQRAARFAVLLCAVAGPAASQPGRSFAEQGGVAFAVGADRLAGRTADVGVGARVWLSDRVAVSAAFSLPPFRPEEVTEDRARPYPGQVVENAARRAPRLSARVERHVGATRTASPFVAVGGSAAHVAYGRDVELWCDPFACPERFQVAFEDRVAITDLTATVSAGLEIRLFSRVTLTAAQGLGVRYTRAVVTPRFPDGAPGEPGRATHTDGLVGTGSPIFSLAVYL